MSGKYSYCKDCRRVISGAQKKVTRKIGDIDGYDIVFHKKYPLVVLPNRHKRVHVYVMERHLGREIRKGEVVHHIDFDRMNWSIENLKLMSDHEHRILHGDLIRIGKVVARCTRCGEEKLYRKVDYQKIKNTGIYQCADCYRISGGGGGRRKLKLANNWGESSI